MVVSKAVGRHFPLILPYISKMSLVTLTQAPLQTSHFFRKQELHIFFSSLSAQSASQIFFAYRIVWTDLLDTVEETRIWLFSQCYFLKQFLSPSVSVVPESCKTKKNLPHASNPRNIITLRDERAPIPPEGLWPEGGIGARGQHYPCQTGRARSINIPEVCVCLHNFPA